MDIDRLKIDQSFVRDLPDNENDNSLVRTIITMAKSLDLDIIGEGIEPPEQLHCLQTLDCPLRPGHFIRQTDAYRAVRGFFYSSRGQQ